MAFPGEIDSQGRQAFTSTNRSLRFWNIATPQLQRSVRCQRSVLDLAFSRDGKALFTGDEGGNVVLWNLKSTPE